MTKLRVNAPEWYPQYENVTNKEKDTHADISETNICRTLKIDNSEPKEEWWKEPRKFAKKLLPIKENHNRCFNRYEMLSNEDEDTNDDKVDDEMSDDSSEENINNVKFENYGEDDEDIDDLNSHVNYEHVRGLTREIMHNEIKTLERVVSIKIETIQMLKVKIDERESEINDIKRSTKKEEDWNKNIMTDYENRENKHANSHERIKSINKCLVCLTGLMN